jgi:hypothetical protein
MSFGRKRRKVKPGDAMHAASIAAHLPSPEAMYNEAKEAQQFFHDSSRAGAGGTKSGATGLRFIDRKKLSVMHERFTETGKISKSSAPKANMHEFIGGKAPDGPKLRIISLPSNYCPDCDTANFPIKEGWSLTVSPVLTAWDAINLRPGDVIRHAICADCHKKAKKGTGSPLRVFIQGMGDVPVSVLETAQRNERIAENIEAFAKTAWSSRRENTFYDEDGKDMARGN